KVCAVTPADVERSGACVYNPQQLSLSASSLEGIWKDIQQVAERLSLAQRGHTLVEGERRRIQTVSEQTASFRRPTVVMLEWPDPLFAMGNWGPELVDIANGELLLARKREF